MRIARASLAIVLPLVAGLAAAETSWPRLLGQLHVGTAGAEPGIAAEWDLAIDGGRELRLRPEVFFNDPPRPGIAASVSVSLLHGRLPQGHELFVGGRLAYHNDRRDHPRRDQEELRYGFEAAGVAFYALPIVPSRPGRHWIEGMLALGVVDHDDDWDPAITVGAAYGYQF